MVDFGSQEWCVFQNLIYCVLMSAVLANAIPMNTNQHGKQGYSQGSLWPLPSSGVRQGFKGEGQGCQTPASQASWWVHHPVQGHRDPQRHHLFLGSKQQQMQVINTILVETKLILQTPLHAQKPRVPPGYSQPELGHLLLGDVACWGRGTNCFIYPDNCVPSFSKSALPPCGRPSVIG